MAEIKIECMNEYQAIHIVHRGNKSNLTQNIRRKGI